jgi:hypothetical protein
VKKKKEEKGKRKKVRKKVTVTKSGEPDQRKR